MIVAKSFEQRCLVCYSCSKRHELKFGLRFSSLYHFLCVTILHANLCTHILASLFPGFHFSLGQHSTYLTSLLVFRNDVISNVTKTMSRKRHTVTPLTPTHTTPL